MSSSTDSAITFSVPTLPCSLSFHSPVSLSTRAILTQLARTTTNTSKLQQRDLTLLAVRMLSEPQPLLPARHLVVVHSFACRDRLVDHCHRHTTPSRLPAQPPRQPCSINAPPGPLSLAWTLRSSAHLPVLAGATRLTRSTPSSRPRELAQAQVNPQVASARSLVIRATIAPKSQACSPPSTCTHTTGMLILVVAISSRLIRPISVSPARCSSRHRTRPTPYTQFIIEASCSSC